MKNKFLLATISTLTLLLNIEYTNAANIKGVSGVSGIGGSGTTTQEGRKVVVLFSGFSGSSGGISSDPTGMQKLNDHLQNTFGKDPNQPFSSKEFGHSEQEEALDYIKSFDDVDEIILIGHSFGGDATVELATDYLKPENIKVDLLIQIDSVGAYDDILPSNVKEGINYWQEKTGILESQGEKEVKAENPEKTKVHNINIEELLGKDPKDITHTTIDDFDDLPDFKKKITNNVRTSTIPEPLTILGAGTAIAFGTGFKRKLSKTKKK